MTMKKQRELLAGRGRRRSSRRDIPVSILGGCDRLDEWLMAGPLSICEVKFYWFTIAWRSAFCIRYPMSMAFVVVLDANEMVRSGRGLKRKLKDRHELDFIEALDN